MASGAQVLSARKRLSSVLGVDYDKVTVSPNDTTGGALFTVENGGSPIDPDHVGKLKEALQRATGANVTVNEEGGRVKAIDVSGGIDMDGAIERMAKINTDDVAKQAFKGRRRT